MASPVLAPSAHPVIPEPDISIIDSASRFGPQRTIQLLGDAGVFEGDEARGAVLVAKRINHALFGDFSREGMSDALLERVRAMQEKYRQVIRETPYDHLVDSGKLNSLLANYTHILLERSSEKLTRLKEGSLHGQDETNPASLLQLIDKEERKIHGLKGELATYQQGGDYTRQLLRRIEKLVRLDRYVPLGKLVVHSGMVAGASPDAAADIVNDVLGIAAARHIRMLAGRFDCVGALDATRCGVVAMAERQMTQPLSSLFEFETENAQLDCITALRTLLSAQLHHAFSKENLTQVQQVALEKAAKNLTLEYAQAAMSLTYHYLCEGAAKDDKRVGILRGNFRKEMEQGGIALIADPAEATDKARRLARASAEDLLALTSGDEKLRTMIKTLAKAAGDPVERMPLAARPQLIGTEIDDPADFTKIVTPRYLESLRTAQEAALRKTSYAHAGVIPGMAS